MATFQRRYSTAQDEAIIAAQLDRGWSAVRAVEAAAAGELPVPGTDKCLVAFTMPAGTARDKAGDERRRRRAGEIVAAGPSAALDELAAGTLTMLERERRRLERKAAAGKLTVGEIGALARAAREVAALVKTVARGPAPLSPADPGKQDGDAPPGFLEGLAGK